MNSTSAFHLKVGMGWMNGMDEWDGWMVKNRCKILWLAFILAIFGISPATGADTFLPVWQVGERWLVKVVYPSHLNEDEWSAPVYWEYKIVGREEHGSESCYVLEIKDQKGGLKLSARFMYRLKDLSLARAEITKTRRGKQVVKVLTYERNIPILTEQTLTPYDKPVFPLHHPSSTDFSVTRKISPELKASETIRQEVRPAYAVAELPDWPGDRKLIEVKCTAGDGTIIFIQYWNKNLPWPVYGQNRNMKYWLVER